MRNRVTVKRPFQRRRRNNRRSARAGHRHRRLQVMLPSLILSRSRALIAFLTSSAPSPSVRPAACVPGRWSVDRSYIPRLRRDRPGALERHILKRHGPLDLSHHLPHERQELRRSEIALKSTRDDRFETTFAILRRERLEMTPLRAVHLEYPYFT
eukprot:7385662-Prymnesium_polylepis.1